MGIEPTYPSEKYGYIIPETARLRQPGAHCSRRSPTPKTAEQYIAQGALWNGGVFAYQPGLRAGPCP